MNFDITYEGRTTLSVDRQGALELGYPADIIANAIKSAAARQVANFADGYRAKIASQSAGKLAEYRFKEEIARDPASADAAELALISREAAARGTNRTGLIGLIKVQAAAYRQIALLIGVLEAEAAADIAAIDATADDIEAQIQTVLGAAKAKAEIAFSEAQVLING